MRAAAVVIGLLALLLAPLSIARAGPFSDWSAVVVAGDNRAHSGGPTEAFDNARRDVAKALVALGFDNGSVRQLSVRPRRDPATVVGRADGRTLAESLRAGARTTKGGCLFYLSSHGSPDGAVLGQELLRPYRLAALLDDACPDRPTVVVISACFSGVFIPALQKRDRLILTAARADRASFGCGESDRYPYFDTCFLASLPDAHDFSALSADVQACVARKERETGAEPASEPQVWIGPALRPLLPLYAFEKPSPRTP